MADVSVPGFWVECKVGKAPPLRPALEQAIVAMGDRKGMWPVAVVKEDRYPATVTMRMDDFLELVGEWWERGRC